MTNLDRSRTSADPGSANHLKCPRFLLIGGGRVSRHFAHYFELQKIEFDVWTRSSSFDRLDHLAAQATHFLLLISDRSIEPFYREHLASLVGSTKKVVIHFSGALVSSSMIGAHPLMTFGEDLYDLPTYQRIPFVIDQGTALSALLPGLPNPSYEMAPQMKPLYHALCVMSGNFTTMLWEKAFGTFEAQLNLPRQVLHPYLSQITKNLLEAKDGASVLTGPHLRGDHETIQKHVTVLSEDPFLEVYEAFGSAFAKARAANEKVSPSLSSTASSQSEDHIL